MPDRKRVNLTVDPETKNDWKQAVEDSDTFRSLSELIRHAVNNEISDDTQATQTAVEAEESDTGAVQAEALNQVLDALEGLNDTVSDLDDRLTNVEKEVTAEAKADLKNRVFDCLPKESDANQPDGKTAEQIAEEIDEDRDRVSETLLKLQTQTATVNEAFTLDEGQIAWCREE
ncbi:hypothetical protein [Halorientalis marina]|uniref:hypothetical protein n=1 Tax=Halorientalis marina TaxID=2931976 RepID=UPI001FF530E3|nr:hypothetical protein [Halorientalis marina]